MSQFGTVTDAVKQSKGPATHQIDELPAAQIQNSEPVVAAVGDNQTVLMDAQTAGIVQSYGCDFVTAVYPVEAGASITEQSIHVAMQKTEATYGMIAGIGVIDMVPENGKCGRTVETRVCCRSLYANWDYAREHYHRVISSSDPKTIYCGCLA